MQALVLQLTRFGFLLLLWLFIWLTLRALRSDIRPAADRADRPRQPRGTKAARTLVVTHGPLAGARIQLGDQPVLLGRGNDATVVLNDDYASNHHARLVPKGGDWFVEDLGSTNGTFLDRNRVTTPVKVSPGAPIRVGKTVIELRP